jgi:tRNA modification GTPase
MLTERADIRGIAISLVDTAGIRDTDDVVEAEGVQRARQAAAIAALQLLVLDRSRPLQHEDRALLASAQGNRIVVVNKSDLGAAWSSAELGGEAAGEAVAISAVTGDGLDVLLDRMAAQLGAGDERRDSVLVSNLRHIELLQRARAAMRRAMDALGASNGAVSEEFVLADLQDAAAALQEITGRRTPDEMLAYIFARFCIGK